MLAHNNSLLTISDERLFSMVRNNIHGNDVIFGSAIAIEPGVYKYPSYCPYAYKKNDTVFAHDIAINYNYLDVSTEWYQAVKIRNWDNITIKVDQVKYRYILTNKPFDLTRGWSLYLFYNHRKKTEIYS